MSGDFQSLVYLSAYLWAPFFFLSCPLAFFLEKKRTAFSHRKIVPKVLPKHLERRAAYHTIKSIFFFNIFAILMFYVLKSEVTLIYDDWSRWSYIYLFASFFVLHFLHDAYFYWTHYLMHKVKWFIKIHKVHHECDVPTPFAVFSFSFWEAVFQALFFLIVPFILPMHWFVFTYFYFFVYWISTWGHVEFEFWPRRLYRLPYSTTFNAVTHHNLHHYYKTKNFGLYYRFWDDLMGTVHPDTYHHFNRVYKNIQGHPQNDPRFDRAHPDDTVGLYFEQQQDFGDDINIRFFLNDKKNGHYFAHSAYDGTAAFHSLLKSKNWKLLEAPNLKKRPFSFWKTVRQFIMLNFSLPYRPSPWKTAPRAGENAVHLQRFSRAETEKIVESARELGVSVNTLLLFNLQKELRQYLEIPERSIWMVPVSLRKKDDKMEGNRVSFLDLFNAETNVVQLHRKIDEKINNSTIWASYWCFKLLDLWLRLFFIPLAFASRYLLKRNAVFTNLGRYSVETEERAYFTAPVSKMVPLSIGALTLNNEILICYHAHPSCGLALEHLEAMAKGLKRELCEGP